MKRKKIIVLFGALTIIAATLIYGHTAVIALRLRTSVSSAQSVKLEVFDGGDILEQRELSRDETSAVLRAFPLSPQLPVSLTVKMCFIPHHRVVIRNPDGEATEYLICFQCDQYLFPGTGIRDMPPDWASSTRQLFQQFGLSLSPKSSDRPL